MTADLVGALLGVATIVLAGALGWAWSVLQDRKAERERQRRYPWLEPIRHRGAK